MTGAFDTLQDRGFIYQTTDEAAIRTRLNGGGATFYVGFDPTADSLHVGHLLPVMAMRWLQRGGHRPIALVGGSTAMVGDPTGRTSARPILTQDDVNHNLAAIQGQLSKFLDFAPGQALMVNNYDWLGNLKYIDFLRDVGRHFSINRMLGMESVKLRMEVGLSFLEFNYMLLQAYDFHHLHRAQGCEFQFGGQDQWGNIVAGIELTRRMDGAEVYGATFPLLLKSDGTKFGKSAGGAVWLDPQRTPPFDYYQFWRNADDADVGRLLGFFTDLPMDEVRRLAALPAPAINRAKEILAFEATAMVHGRDEAARAYAAAGQAFGFADPEGKIPTSSAVAGLAAAGAELPSYELKRSDLGSSLKLTRLLALSGLCGSGNEARRLVESGGAYVNDQRIGDVNAEVSEQDFSGAGIVLRAGKKKQLRIRLG